MEHDQRFSRHGRVGEGVATAIWPHSALQVSPVPYGMHGLIPSRRSVLVFHAFLSDRRYAWESARPVNVRMVGLEFLCKPLNYFLKASLTDSSNGRNIKGLSGIYLQDGENPIKIM